MAVAIATRIRPPSSNRSNSSCKPRSWACWTGAPARPDWSTRLSERILSPLRCPHHHSSTSTTRAWSKPSTTWSKASRTYCGTSRPCPVSRPATPPVRPFRPEHAEGHSHLHILLEKWPSPRNSLANRACLATVIRLWGNWLISVLAIVCSCGDFHIDTSCFNTGKSVLVTYFILYLIM